MTYSTWEQTGTTTNVSSALVGHEVDVENYEATGTSSGWEDTGETCTTTSSDPPSAQDGYRWVYKGSVTVTSRSQRLVSDGHWQDTSETCWRWFYEGDPGCWVGLLLGLHGLGVVGFALAMRRTPRTRIRPLKR